VVIDFRHTVVRFLSILLVFSSPPCLAGCHKKPLDKPAVDYSKQLPAGQMALRKIPPEQYPNFSMNAPTLAALRKSVDNSLTYMQAPSTRTFFPYLDIDHDRAVATLLAFRDMIDEESGHPSADTSQHLNAQIRERFEVYKSVGAPQPDGSGYTDSVLFTGYCTPVYDASLTRTDQFKWPLYKRPADLVSDPNTGIVLGRKSGEDIFVPYYTRSEIETGGKLAGQELVWLKNRWDAYVITVQGSARLKLTDGKILEVGYAGNNGYEYTSPGKQMIADGAITEQQLTLKDLRAYFDAHPEAMDKYLTMNKRFVFFADRPGGPFGSLNVPVTPFASIATDKSVYPRAMPAFLSVDVPTSDAGNTQAFRGFMMDQDAGGAIRAAGRCDIYMGIGPEAEMIAGHQLHAGELYYIAIKSELIGQYKPK
jgi:membrane-bound lytic murein transglycosylase A